MSGDLLEHVKAAGFPYWQNIVHLFVGGSELHGAKVGDGSDDTDIYGVFLEPPEKVLGITAYEHFIWSTGGTDRKNMAGDIDITLYSLRKWAYLACKGNPSVLHFLFAKTMLTNEPYDPWFSGALACRQIYLARSHSSAFLGYASAQMMALAGLRSRDCTRPELVEKYGFDTKYAMHIIRVLSECLELMETGVITLPNPRKADLISIRTGGWTQEQVMDEGNALLAKCKIARDNSPLKETINRDAVSVVIAESYRRFWQSRYRL